MAGYLGREHVPDYLTTAASILAAWATKHTGHQTKTVMRDDNEAIFYLQDNQTRTAYAVRADDFFVCLEHGLTFPPTQEHPHERRAKPDNPRSRSGNTLDAFAAHIATFARLRRDAQRAADATGRRRRFGRVTFDGCA